MMKRIMKTGVVAVALAASALLATPAVAQVNGFGERGVTSSELRGGPGFRGDRSFRHDRQYGHSPRLNEFGQTRAEVQHLVDQAIYECDCQLKLDADYVGYRGAELRRPRVEQIGKRKFVVHARARLFDGYNVNRQSYECLVRRGSVRRATDLFPVQHARFHRDGYQRRGLTLSFSNW